MRTSTENWRRCFPWVHQVNATRVESKFNFSDPNLKYRFPCTLPLLNKGIGETRKPKILCVVTFNSINTY